MKRTACSNAIRWWTGTAHWSRNILTGTDCRSIRSKSGDIIRWAARIALFPLLAGEDAGQDRQRQSVAYIGEMRLSIIDIIVNGLALRVFYQPVLIFFISLLLGELQRNNAGAVIAVKLFNPLGQIFNIMIGRFGNEDGFLIFDDLSFPSIDRFHAVNNIDARGQFFFNQFTTYGLGLFFTAGSDIYKTQVQEHISKLSFKFIIEELKLQNS